MPGNTSGYHIWCYGDGAIDMWWVEARDAAKHSTLHKTAPYNKELSSPKCQLCTVLKQCNTDTFSLHVLALLGYIHHISLHSNNVAANSFEPTTLNLRCPFLDKSGKSPCIDSDWPSLDHSLTLELTNRSGYEDGALSCWPRWATCPLQGQKS